MRPLRSAFAPIDDEFEPRWKVAKQIEDKPPRIARRGGYVAPPGGGGQRVVTRTTFAEKAARGPVGHAATLRRDASYLAHEGRTLGEPAFDKDGKLDGPAAERVASWSGDGLYYRISINPEKGNEISDFQGYVRDVMQEVEDRLVSPWERSLGRGLDWVAAVHENTGRRHAHVLLRGHDGEEEMRMTEAFWRHGLRHLASEVATRREHAGPRLEKELSLSMDAPRHGRGLDLDDGDL